jgi:Tfp pilus assembly protein PilE
MKNNGISLIILVITIIVIIILAGAVILTLAQNNPITEASKATYLSDLKNFQTELELYKTKQYLDTLGTYDPTLLQADANSVTYDGIVNDSINIHSLIPSLEANSSYSGQFEILNGSLVFVGYDTNKQDWARGVGVGVVLTGEPMITIVSLSPSLVAKGTDIIYTIEFSSNAPLTSINIDNNVELLDESGVAINNQPDIVFGTVSGTNLSFMRNVDVTVKTDDLENGIYKLSVKAGAVTNEYNISNSQRIIEIPGFEVDSAAPENPTMVVNPADWTNSSVEISITYSSDSVTKQYSLDGISWYDYIDPIIVTDNNITVYAMRKRYSSK